MHALIVVAHPDPGSLTQAMARQVAAGIAATPGHGSEIADLTAEGFDPRFSAADYAQFQRRGPSDPAVLAEQRRIDRVDALVLVYPIYWWSMPGLLKGWIDRVFAQGWAYDDRPEGLEKKLGRLAVQLLAIGGADAGTYARHDYARAMQAQIDHGIFGYCGARLLGSETLLPQDAPEREAALRRAFAIGQALTRA